MRVAIISDSLNLGGAERQAVYTARTVARMGCATQLIYYRPSANAFSAAEVAPGDCIYLPREGGPWRHLGLLTRHLRSGQFDVVHGFKGVAAAYACFAGRRAGVSVLLAGYREPLNKSARRNRWLMHLVKHVAHGWIVNASHIKRTLVDGLRLAPDRVDVVNNGVDLDRWVTGLSPADARDRIGLPASARVIGIVARLRPEKNHAILLTALSIVRRQLDNVHVLLVGDGPLENALRTMAGDLGITDSVHFLGNRTDVAEILAAVDVSVIISRHEGLSNALLESMAAGVPVITTDYPGVDELVDDGCDGVLTPLDDPAALADRLLALLGDEDRRAALARAAQAKIRDQFSNEIMGRRMIAVYEKHLATRRGTRSSSMQTAGGEVGQQ